jgi:hypothetical protein
VRHAESLTAQAHFGCGSAATSARHARAMQATVFGRRAKTLPAESADQTLQEGRLLT